MFVEMSGKLTRIAACLLAVVLLLGIALGNGGVETETVLAAEEQVVPTQAVDGEKPYVNIVTNIVVDTAGKPTGYVELALLVKTPKFNDTQTTFSNIAVNLEYNAELLVPVSWDHQIQREGDTDTGAIINNYPDFVDPENDIDHATATDADLIARATVVNDKFNNANPYSFPVNVLRHADVVEGNMAFVGGRSTSSETGTATSYISISASSVDPIVLEKETPLVVVRFLYTGTNLSSVIQSSGTVDQTLTVNQDLITSGHDEKGNSSGGTLKSLFWFAPDDAMADSPTNQALYYSAGDYLDKDYGENYFYATKVVYNGIEVTLPDHIKQYPTETSDQNYSETTSLMYADGDKLDRPLTGTDNPASSEFDSDVKTVKAKDTTKSEGDDGYYSYTSNLLFTSDTADSKTAAELYDAHTNIRFGVVAQESYRSTGGVDISQVATIVFLDWDDTILGALAVVKGGDARAAVNAYVENFIHPSLRYSDDNNAGIQEQLATSLERRYTYAGKYNNTDNDNDKIFDSGAVEDGEDYPLTNKLDYAFMRRPVVKSVTMSPTDEDDTNWAYRNSNNKAVTATEWTTGTVDWENGDYPYVYGWAVVDDPREADSVWTTFGGYGELAHVKLPGYDTDVIPDNDGLDQFRNNIIREAGVVDTNVGAAKDGVKSYFDTLSATPTETEISFATYGDSEYFKFADFSKIDESTDAIFVKACYEPAEELSWTDYYVVTSTQPYYEKAGLPGSTVKGSAYTISFDYERIHAKDNPKGVLRLRSPAARIKFISDDSGQNGDESYLEGYVTNTDVLEMSFSPSGLHIAVEYTLVETYGGDYIAAIDRSKQGNEAEILDNFFYKEDSELADSHEDGFSYANRFGSDGFVYWATLRQILKEGSELITAGASEDELATFASSYLSRDTLVDLNLRIDANGTSPLNASQTQYYDTTDAIVEAIDIALKNNRVDATGVANLDWHQLQYHILNKDSGGILQNGSILEPSECGNYPWCRLDGCSDGVSVNSLAEALTAVYTARLDTTANAAKKQAAEAALTTNLPGATGVLAASKVIKDDAGEIIATEAISAGAYQIGDVADVVNALEQLLRKVADDGGDYTQLNAAQVQNWLTTYAENPATATYADPGLDESPELTNPRFKYWWHYYASKPQAVDFDGVTGPTAVEKLIEAAVSSHNGNLLAWSGLTVDHIEDMRFAKSERGDFFYTDNDDDGDGIADAYTAVKSGYDEYRAHIRDTRADSNLVLEAYTEADRENFITAVTRLIEEIADGDGDGTWITTSSIALEWEQVQYYLLYGSRTNNPSYYREVYWWDDDPDGFRLDKFDAPDEKGYLFEGTTIADLRSKLFLYAGASPSDREALADEFKIWFTPEVAIDLILRYENGWIISQDYRTAAANRLLSYALLHAQADPAFSEFTWDQVQYAVINGGAYTTTKSAQANLTYDSAKCSWGTKGTTDGTDSRESNRWREGYRESITDLKVLIEAIDTYSSDDANAKLKSIESFADLASENLFFNTSNDLLYDDFESYRGTRIADALADLKNICGDEWVNVVSSVANYDYDTYKVDLVAVDAWYLIQYYLENGDIDTSFTQTATAGKDEYCWEYGWSGISSTAEFRKAVESGVPARMSYIEITYASGPAGYVDNIHGAAHTDTTWSYVIAEAKSLVAKHTEDGTSLLTDPWWRQLQFLVAHMLQENAEGMLSIATTEANNYYWWHKNGSAKVLTLADTPTDTDAARATAAATIMEAALLKYAAGNTVNDFFAGDAAGTLAAYLNIRNANDTHLAANEGTSRNDIPYYTTEQINQALQALVAAVYESSVTGAAAGWDYVTNFADNKITSASEMCVYTYNSAAYNALKNLTAHQIQHWFYTYFNNGAASASYNATDAEAAGYWWITDATKQSDVVTFADFQDFVKQLITYAAANNETQFKALIEKEWDKYGFGTTVTAAKASARIAVFKRMTTTGTYSWAQIAIVANKGALLKTSQITPAVLKAQTGITAIPEGFDGTFTLTFD